MSIYDRFLWFSYWQTGKFFDIILSYIFVLFPNGISTPCCVFSKVKIHWFFIDCNTFLPWLPHGIYFCIVCREGCALRCDFTKDNIVLFGFRVILAVFLLFCRFFGQNMIYLVIFTIYWNERFSAVFVCILLPMNIKMAPPCAI